MDGLSIEPKILQKLTSHSSDITSIDFFGNSLLVSGSSDKTVRVWRWIMGSGFCEESFSPLLGHKYGVTSVRVSSKGGVIASASVDGTVILWNLSTGQISETFTQEGREAIRACIFSPNGFFVVSSDDAGCICVWGLDRTLKKHIKCHEEAIHSLAFSSDSNILLAACTSGNIKIFVINEGFEHRHAEPDCSIDAAHDMGVLSADFCKIVHKDPTDNFTKIYTVGTCGTDQIIKIWRIYYMARGGVHIKSRLIPSSPHERISGISSIYCSEIMNAECIISIPAHGSSVTCIKFNATGTLLISCGLDKTVKIWNQQGAILRTLNEHTRYVNCVAINGDSTIVASGSNDRQIIIWDITNSYTLNSRISGIRSMLFTLVANSVDVPLEFICPITHEFMKDPVIAEDGFTYERLAIEEWFSRDKIVSPMTNMELQSKEVIFNGKLKQAIDDYLKMMDFDSFE